MLYASLNPQSEIRNPKLPRCLVPSSSWGGSSRGSSPRARRQPQFWKHQQPCEQNRAQRSNGQRPDFPCIPHWDRKPRVSSQRKFLLISANLQGVFAAAGFCFLPAFLGALPDVWTVVGFSFSWPPRRGGTDVDFCNGYKLPGGSSSPPWRPRDG